MEEDDDTEEDEDNSLDPLFLDLAWTNLRGGCGRIHMEDDRPQWRRNKRPNRGADSVMQALTIEEFRARRW